MMFKKFFIHFLLIGIVLVCNVALANDKNDKAVYVDFSSTSAHQLTDKITLQFVTSDKFTVIQWNLKEGAKLPLHSHPNEQVTRILQGNVEVHTGESVYHLHAGDIMIFPSNVTHSFIATSDALMYELQTPIREDFLKEDFIEKISALLKQNQ